MNNRVLEQILVGSTVALFTVIINESFAGKINYFWALGGFLGSMILYGAYQRFGGSPFKKWRVTNENDGKGLLFRADILSGRKVGEAWQFKTTKQDWAIYGPYLRQLLHKGKYRATFRIKVDDIKGEDHPLFQIDIASNCKYRGDKRLAGRTVTCSDFTEADEYQEFILDFYVVSNERELELRIFSEGTGETVTLDYIRLSRRLF